MGCNLDTQTRSTYLGKCGASYRAVLRYNLHVARCYNNTCPLA